jgi:hypothetical protein
MATAALRLAPDFRVTINGNDVPSALRQSIMSVRYQDGTQAAYRVEIAVANVDLRWLQQHIKGLGFHPFPTGVAFGPVHAKLAEENLFDIDNTLRLSLGYAPGEVEEVFKGDITGVQASFPSGGMPTMTIVAHDYLHRFMNGRYARGFGPLPDALIAAILSAVNLIIPLIDPTLMAASTAVAVVNYIFKGTGTKQAGQSDLDLMREIAALYDADFWVEGDFFYFSRFIPKEYSPRLTLRWGESLLDFSPKVNTLGQVAGAGMKFTLRELPISFLVNAFWDFDHETLGIRVIPGQAAGLLKMAAGPTNTLITHPIGSPADIMNSVMLLAHELRTKINTRLTGSGSAVGDPRIRAGAVIRLEGLGPDFSGDYRVSSATHTIDSSGYRTSFEVRKELIP